MTQPSQAQVRREIQRLVALFGRYGESQPTFEVMRGQAHELADRVEACWRVVGSTRIRASHLRAQRDVVFVALRRWHKQWRHVVLITVPGAAENRATIPQRNRTHDGAITVAEGLLDFINTAEAAARYREAAVTELGDLLERARQTMGDAVVARREEARTRTALRVALAETRAFVQDAKKLARAALGPTSPEYKALVRHRATPAEEKAGLGDEADGAAAAKAGKKPAAEASPASDATTSDAQGPVDGSDAAGAWLEANVDAGWDASRPEGGAGEGADEDGLPPADAKSGPG